MFGWKLFKNDRRKGLAFGPKDRPVTSPQLSYNHVLDFGKYSGLPQFTDVAGCMDKKYGAFSRQINKAEEEKETITSKQIDETTRKLEELELEIKMIRDAEKKTK